MCQMTSLNNCWANWRTLMIEHAVRSCRALTVHTLQDRK